ncbi:MAG: hypothetical protein REI11_20560, partial [Patulibacter sp.]|nr:hypothetical protein [Patulibacter sp.]
MFRPTVIRRTALYPLLSIALVLPSAAAGADLHVSAAGDGSCTVASQGCTLTAALGAAQPGDRIVVHGGVYRVSGQVSDGAGGVSIVAAPNEPRPVLDLSAGTLWLTHDTDVSGIDLSTTNGTALVVAGGTLDRVRIGVTGAGATGVNLGSGATLRNSTVIATGSGATGIHASGAPLRSTILGSTLLAAGAGAAAVSVSPDAPATSATLRAVNTIFSGTNGALDLRVASDASSSATAVLHHSATSPTRQSVIGAGASIDQTDGTITADPHFVDRSSGDLRQAADSPTIDAGTAETWRPDYPQYSSFNNSCGSCLFGKPVGGFRDEFW